MNRGKVYNWREWLSIDPLNEATDYWSLVIQRKREGERGELRVGDI